MTTLTSTGNVTDDSATNWSPSQVPAAGDDLIVNHTITFNQNWQGAGRLGSIAFNGVSARFAFSGTKIIEAENGFSVGAGNNGALCTTSIDASRDLTLRGKWSLVNGLSTNFRIADGSGGNLWVGTIGDDETAVVVEQLGIGSYRIVNSWTGGLLTIKGRVDGAASVSGINIVAASGGFVTWNSVGTNYAGSGNANAIQISGSGRINFTGSFESSLPTANGGILSYSSSDTGSTFGQTGDVICQKGMTTGIARTAAIFMIGGGSVAIGGKVVAKNKALAIYQQSGLISYTNESFAIASGESLSAELIGGTLDLSGTEISNSGRVALLELSGGSIVTDEGTLITNQSTAAQAACNTTALDGKIITLESDPPTLPAVNKVQAGTTYGYSESIKTGTGLLIDPAVLAAAVRTGVGLESSNLDTQLTGITTAIENITIDQGAPLSSTGQVGILHKGGTYWFTVECFDESGASIILDEPPTVVVLKNNVETEDVVTITDRDEDGRHYDCEYNPVGEVEGDRFEIRVSVLINNEVYTRPSEHLVVIASPNLDDRLNEVLTNAREAAQNSQ